MEWGTTVKWGWFLLFSHKTKETYPTRPGSPTPCKQGLKLLVFERKHNNDGDVIDNGKKTIGLDWQNNNFSVRASRFFVHFFAVTARLRRENT